MTTALTMPGGAMSPASQRTGPRPPPRQPPDRAQLRTTIAEHRRQLAELEASLVAECEEAAVRGHRHRVDPQDRETWDRATWGRYLAAATRLEPRYGRRMVDLHRTIERLTRLAEHGVGP